MKITPTKIIGLKIIEPKIFTDSRGFFFESFNNKLFNKELGLNKKFVQDNHSKSCIGVLRGLHYQLNNPQGKLIRVIQGEIFDVAVDLRRESNTFGEWFGIYLSAGNKKQLWVPEGFAHGFLVVSKEAEVLYKTTDFYSPGDEYAVLWNDPDLGIKWPKLDMDFVLSEKDALAYTLKNAILN